MLSHVRFKTEGDVPFRSHKRGKSSVQEAAKAFITDKDRLDVLMNNVGGIAQPAALTENGFEVHLGTNHIVGPTHEKTYPKCQSS